MSLSPHPILSPWTPLPLSQTTNLRTAGTMRLMISMATWSPPLTRPPMDLSSRTILPCWLTSWRTIITSTLTCAAICTRFLTYEFFSSSIFDLTLSSQIVRSLPPTQLKMALIQQATILSNQQLLIETKALCSTVHDVATKIYKSLSDNAQITKHQMVWFSGSSRPHSYPCRAR